MAEHARHPESTRRAWIVDRHCHTSDRDRRTLFFVGAIIAHIRARWLSIFPFLYSYRQRPGLVFGLARTEIRIRVGIPIARNRRRTQRAGRNRCPSRHQTQTDSGRTRTGDAEDGMVGWFGKFTQNRADCWHASEPLPVDVEQLDAVSDRYLDYVYVLDAATPAETGVVGSL